MKSTTALVAAILALVVAACGGASDEVGGGDAPKAAGGGTAEATKLALVAYAVPKVGFDKVIPLFTTLALNDEPLRPSVHVSS